MKRNLSNERDFSENYGVPINYIPSCMRVLFFLFHLTQKTRGYIARHCECVASTSIRKVENGVKGRKCVPCDRKRRGTLYSSRSKCLFLISLSIIYIHKKKKNIFAKFAKFEIKLSNELISLKKN